MKPQESSYIKFNFYTLCEQAQRQSPGRRPTGRAAKPRGSADPTPARLGFRVEGGGAAVREGGEPPSPSWGRRSPAARRWGRPRGRPVVRARAAEHARRLELRRGRVLSPAPSGALSQRGRRAAPRRPRGGLSGRDDSPRPQQGLRACESRRPPIRRRASSRRDPAGGGPRTLALPADLPPPPPEAHAGRGQAQKASDSEIHTISSIPLLPKNSRRNAP